MPDPNSAIVLASPHPLLTAHGRIEVPAGLTLAQILDVVQPDAVLREYAHIFLDDEPIRPERWNETPRPGAQVLINVVPMGGEGGGKNPLRTILTLAILVVGTVYGGPLGLALGLKGKFAVAVGTALISGGGTLLINAIAPLPAPTFTSRHQDSESSAVFAIESARNSGRPFGAVPSVLGRHRMVPPLGARIYTELHGRDQYLRMLVVWGYGPLSISDLRIGETPITDFEDVEVETREGRDTDAPLTLYTDRVFQESFSVLLVGGANWTTKRTELETTEISVDVSFPRGLSRLEDTGRRSPLTVAIDIEYRKVGEVAWTVFRAPGEPPSVSVDFVSSTTTPFREGWKWTPADGPGQFDVRFRRTTAERPSDRDFDEIYWSALRSIEAGSPIAFAKPVAVTAIRIRATDQLHGSIDRLNAVVESPMLDWNGAAWLERVSSNPASVYRHVMQGAARANPPPDNRVDLEALQDWHEFCAANSYEYNGVRDFSGSVDDALREVAAAGRASPSYADGKWSVVVDTGMQLRTQHFGPRNSQSFNAQRSFQASPDALRVRFKNRDQGWRNDERIVYRDGYDEDSAEKFSTIEARGITDPDHAWRFGRFHLAQVLLRRELWSLEADFEYLVASRGSRVLLTHDVLLVGQKMARIKSLTKDASGDITAIEIDEEVRTVSGTRYGVSIRTPGDPAVIEEVSAIN